LIHPARASATARVLVPSSRARFGLISDIDDTVVYSNVTRKLRMVFTAAFSNARTRKPFKGVAAFYRALHAGVNPVFYVSKSPWNLFAPIVEYLEVQGLPAGPVLLRDFGLRPQKEHKRQDHRGDPGHLPWAQVHPERRQRRAGPGDLRRHRAALSRSRAGDLHPLSEHKENFRDSEAGGARSPKPVASWCLAPEAGSRRGARRGRRPDSGLGAARGALGAALGGLSRREQVLESRRHRPAG
jgi:hypothetical protein